MSNCQPSERAASESAWISVEESLPENGKPVEVLAHAVRHGGKWSTQWIVGTTHVTHWRPLPASTEAVE